MQGLEERTFDLGMGSMIMGWGLQSYSKVKDIWREGGNQREVWEVSRGLELEGSGRRDLCCLLPNLAAKRLSLQHQKLPRAGVHTDLCLPTTLPGFMGTVLTTKCHWFSQ